MQFQLTLDENDMRVAVCEWLHKHHSIEVKPEDLEPVIDSQRDGEYEDQVVTNTHIGYRVKPEIVHSIFTGKPVPVAPPAPPTTKKGKK